MPLIYSFVARGTTVLADYTAYTGNFSVIAIQVRHGSDYHITLAEVVGGRESVDPTFHSHAFVLS